MATALYRILKLGVLNFWRNGWLSAATIAVMILALLVFEGLIIFGVLTKAALASIQDKIDISVYFKTTAPEDEILRVKKSLESLAEVKKVEYVSRDEALEMFRSRHQSDATISEALTELNENPLSASLNVKAYDPRQYALIAAYLNNESLSDLVDKVTYFQNEVVINRLTAMIDTVERGGFFLTVFLSLVAGLVVLNTIRLAIYTNREEIGIMRLVGASDRFIRGPYLVEGILYGIISAVVSLLISAPVVRFASPYIATLIPEMDLVSYFVSNLMHLLGYLMLFGVLLATISSSISIRKYLKV
ncbi:MAG: ABC transporter permease [Parcubacteria group bacterium]|nr:ABC transporter permease [Parcubacteria group bacterium]